MHIGDKRFILKELALREERFREAIRKLSEAKEAYKKTFDMEPPAESLTRQLGQRVFPGML